MRQHCAMTRPGKIPLAELVPGDVIQLAAGDMIPADMRIVGVRPLERIRWPGSSGADVAFSLRA